MRKKLLYLVAMIGSFAFTSSAQDCSDLALTVGGGSWTEEISWDITSDGNEVAAGLAGDFTVCLEDGSYSFNMHDSYGDGWNGSTFTLTDADGNEVATGGLTSGSDGSVEFSFPAVVAPTCEGTEITMGGGSYISETSFVIADCDGNVLASDAGAEGEYCVVLPADYTVTMNDSYGDGWNGNILNIGGTEYTLNGSEEVIVVGSCGAVAVPGCTDDTATNYNADATEDDGSCEFAVACTLDALTLNLYDSYGDGGGSITVDGETYTLASGASASFDLCVDLSICTDLIYASTDSWGSENSWDVTDASGAVIASGADASGDVGSCGAVAVPGCTDDTATNYNADATEDDGSCEYAVACEDNALTLSVGGGSWISEISWDITVDGSEVAAGTAGDFDDLCLADGAYSFNMHDSYGDGWNGSVFTLTDADGNVVATGGLETGAEGSVEFILGDVTVPGCTDATATNYNPLANEDDGSCIATVEGCTDEAATNYNADANTEDGSCVYPYACAEGELVLSMVDSYGDGWNGSELIINDVSYTIESGATAEGCVADGCLIFSTVEGSWMSEASWTLSNEAGVVIAEGGLPYAGTVGECSILGCMDVDALNFDANATEDDGSCEYYSCNDTEFTITMVDAYGDGWNGNVLTIGDESFTLESGAEGSAVICLADGVYAVTNGGGSWGEEVSWSIGDALSGGSPFEGTLVVGDVAITGCMDAAALNYNADATEDDGSCEYAPACDATSVAVVVGGGSWAEEISWTITSGDDTLALGAGESTADLCLENGLYSFNMVDSYGDGWNGNVASITDAEGNLIASGTLETGTDGSFTFGIGSGSACELAVALDGSVSGHTSNPWYVFSLAEDGSASVELVSNDLFEGASVVMYDACGGNVVANGDLAAGTYYVEVVPNEAWDAGNFELSLSISILGCTEFNATNYNSNATVDDGSCIQILGCTDATAVNYEPSATQDDGSCVYVSCTATAATMTLTTGSWGGEVSFEVSNTDGQLLVSTEAGSFASNSEYVYDLCLSADSTYQIVMNDAYGDGWNGGVFSITTCEGVYTSAAGGLIAGSTDTLGFTVTACSDFAFGCTDPIAENFDANADTDDGSCEYIVGCTDEIAENYNADATMDDASCEYIVGCTNPDAVNYDEAATQDDDTCITPIVCAEGLTGYAMVMTDSYGDGWNGNTYVFTDADGNVVAEGGLPSSGFTITPEGTSGVDSLCLADGCYFITVDGGSYPEEISWAILDNMNGTSLLSGGAPTVEAFSVNTDCNVVEGCTDDFAINYNADANLDNGTCEYLTSETCEEAIALTSGVEYPGAFGAQVYFSITLEETGFLTVDGAPAAGSFYEPEFAIFTDCGDLFGSGVEAGVLDAGTYYIQVESSSFWAAGNPFVMTATVAALIEGCTDEYAANYDETANIDNGTCEYPCDGINTDLVVMTGSWAGEVSWELLDGEGVLVAGGSGYANATEYVIPLCLNIGETYTMNSYDSYGDGWNGGTYTFVASCGEDADAFTYTAANNGGESPYDSESVNIDGLHLEAAEEFTLVPCADVVAGCMDETMFNYNAEANVADGNCEEFVYGCMDVDGLNYDSAVNTDDGSCVYGCDGEFVTVTVTTGSWASEVSWELYNALGDTLLSGSGYENNTPYSQDICLAIGESFIFSAHDSFGDGWNGGTFSVSSCGDVIEGGVAQAAGTPASGGYPYAPTTEEFQFTVISCADIVPGCLIEEATNYNAEATHSDSSCEFATPSLLTPEDGFVMEMSVEDSITYSWETLYTQAGASNSYSIFWSTDSADLAGSIIIYLYGTDTTEWSGLSTQFYDIFVNNGYGAGDSFSVYWWVCNDINYVSGEGYTGSNDQFTQANEIVLSLAAINGCIDEAAINFDPAATLDDGSCVYPCETTTTLSLSDSWGDGWNGNALTVSYTDMAGAAVDTTVTIETGFDAMICLDIDLASCATFAWTDGSYIGETSWSLTDADGNELAAGAAGSIPAAGLGGCVVGCMDDAYAEYNADADVHDQDMCVNMLCAGDVVSLNLIDSYGDGWNGGFITVNGTDYTIDAGDAASFELCVDLAGCTDVVYTAGSWSEENSWNITDADGNVLVEAGNVSGTVGSDCAVQGCMDESASNYNADATEDDGSCIYPGCTDAGADNYNPEANEDDGSCQYSCADGMVQIDILITTDTYASETSFTLSDDQGGATTVSFSSANNISTVTNSYCVDAGSNMTFVIADEWGDGIMNNGGYEIFVCEESILQNFNFTGATASEEFVASCGVDVVYGCTDASADNYNELATEDDGSCTYPCTGVEATLTVSTASWGSEVSWNLTDAAGSVVASSMAGDYTNDTDYVTDLCLSADADYTMAMEDAYGDGWNGGSFVITSADCDFASGALESGAYGEVVFNASCGSTSPEVGAPFEPVIITDSNHTIMIPANADLTIDGAPMENGDVIGVFYTNDAGEAACAGYMIWNSEMAQIAAMGDDAQTIEIDGYTGGDEFTFMVLDASEGVLWNAQATFMAPGQEFYVGNGLSFISSIAGVPAGPSEQVLNIPSGWSMFSTYMIADDMDMVPLLAPIIDNVIIAKNNAGSAYLVEWAFNGIGDAIVGQGYQIKTNAAVELTIAGAYAFPEENSINLTAGWNMIGYLRTEPADAAAVMADVVNNGDNLVIAKDYQGNAFLPQWGFNGIGDMNAGQGYQLKVNNDDVLNYLSNDDSYRLAEMEIVENNVAHFSKVAPTDNNMTVVIEDAAWDVLPMEGSEVAAFDKAGNLIGSAIYSSPVTVLTVWGDDATTSSKDGLEVSEVVSFKVWTSGTVRDFTVAEWTEGSAAYTVDAINVASTIESNNVVTELNSSDRVLVRVINVLGQEVNSNDDTFKGEVLFNVYDDGTVEKFVN